MSEFPDFSGFYQSVHGRDPFPWQERLARQVAGSGWPSRIGIPTGLGKTACLDIAVWALARQADLDPPDREAPTRIWYVVNRRLLIDQAWSHGLKLATVLASGQDLAGRGSEATREVARALRSLTPFGLEDGPLQITRLRGGAEIGARALEPSQPAIMFSTVAMFASRWLFRGYGTSRSMRPVDAALAGIDSLVLLDEAHLSGPLLALASKVEQCDLGDPSRVLNPKRSRPVIVALTATGEATGARFNLDHTDQAHPLVRQRLDASKPITLHATSERSLVSDLSARALVMLDGQAVAASCVVFVNTPKTARAVVEELERHSSKRSRRSEIWMATGRMRDREAGSVRKRLLDPSTGVPAGRQPQDAREKDLIVVATQTLEVGADLDFDVLVTETPGTRALVQRLGRLNRLGQSPNACGALVHPSDRKQWPVYGEEPPAVWDALTAASNVGVLDLSPARVGHVLGPPADEPKRVGELLHPHLWEWAKTSLPPIGEGPVGLFFEGFDEAFGRVSVCWRAHIAAEDVRLFPGIKEAEAIELPLWELREALGERGIERVSRLADDRSSLETATLPALRPGDQVVLRTTVGLYDMNGWNPAAREEVLDASLLNARILPLSRPAVENLAPGYEVSGLLEQLTDPGEEGLTGGEEDALVTELLSRLRDGPRHPWVQDDEWVAFIDGMRHEVNRPVEDAAFLSHPKVERERVEIRAEAFEEMSFDARSLSLSDHHGVVGETAVKIARATGVAEALIASIEVAAIMHDVGKRDPRFQRWLGRDPDPESPKAKSPTPRHLVERERIAAGWPKGGRHELLSLRLLSEYVASHEGEGLRWDRDLVLHLVAAHHGHGRPLVSPAIDPAPPPLSAEIDGTRVTITSDLAWVDWDQPRRFRALCERYGYWGLALLEAIVRQSDHAASSAGVA